MTEQPLGIFTMPREAYHDDPCEQASLSASIASILCSRSPRHAWAAHPKLNPDFKRQENGRFDIGTCAHALLLENKAVEEIVEVIDAPDYRTKAAQEARDEARANGKLPLLAHVVTEVTTMLAATREQLDAISDAEPPLFTDGLPEQTLIWEEDGITCRALVDWLRDDRQMIDDYKTTGTSADPKRWTRRRLFEQGTDVQAAFYLRGVRAVSGSEAQMRYVIQETYPPYALSVVSLGPDVLAVAEAKVEYAIKRWRECLRSGDWPSYAPRVCYAELPAYIESDWLEFEQREEMAV